MPKRPTANIGKSEMEILHFIQDRHPITVREVADHFSETKGHVRTTILNVMERLREKGFLVRKKVAGLYHYSPRIPKAELMRSLVKDFVDRALGGSVSPFVAYLARDAKLSPIEMRELRRLIKELETQDDSGS